MKLLFLFLFAAINCGAQPTTTPVPTVEMHWKMNTNKLETGAIIFVAGFTKGFNETLVFHWKAFHSCFPHLNKQWFNPALSWKNKYKDGIPSYGPKYPLSTSILVMGTDQYHLNNFINRY